MPDRRLALCGSTLSGGDLAGCVELLAAAGAGPWERIVLVQGKAAAPSGVATLNVLAGYPAELALLQSIGAGLDLDADGAALRRDALDVYGLSRVIARGVSADCVVLLRAPTSAEALGASLGEAPPDQVVRLGAASEPAGVHGPAAPPNILVDLRAGRGAAAVEVMLDLYLCGAVHGLVPYSLERLRRVALGILGVLDHAPPA